MNQTSLDRQPVAPEARSQACAQMLRTWVEALMERSMRHFTQFLREEGLSVPQASTLFRLYYRGPAAVSDISSHLGVTNAAASQMVDRLVQQGYVERWELPEDRRVKQLALTAAGRALIERAIEARQGWLSQVPQHLTPDEQETLMQTLPRLMAAVRQLNESEAETD
ncbi:MAG: MarR family transcriptional regulator [Caldilineales bacterium]|nr:MarR family transcriptional regulator [Caldilineales bacterium]MDW8316539.1 MarR family transcriptional regulator [Anaerolineae bacterium]